MRYYIISLEDGVTKKTDDENEASGYSNEGEYVVVDSKIGKVLCDDDQIDIAVIR